MANMQPGGDFYEDDEPVDKVVAAFEQGPKTVTTPPRGRTAYLRTEPFPRQNETAGRLVKR